VFCERGAFSVDEARAVLTAGQARGLIPRIHASQLGPGRGVLLAVELGAASADHCTFLTDADVDALAAAAPSGDADPAGTVATLLPGAEFGTRQPYPDARRLLDAGATVALATDCNPGSSFTSSMAFCIAVAVRDMHMTTSEAVWAATAGGARALRRTDVGYLAPGARADLVMLDAPSHAYLAYRPGVPLVHAVWQSGKRQP
jgi:imidazolonepropionase